MERVIWADNDWRGVSFRNFDTIYYPNNITELLDWIKNRDDYDAKEQAVLNALIIKPKKQSLSPRIQHITPTPQIARTSTKQTNTFPTIPPPAIITSNPESENIPREYFHKESNVQDQNGNRLFLCTECEHLFYETDMSSYQYAKGICRTCMRKKETSAP